MFDKFGEVRIPRQKEAKLSDPHYACPLQSDIKYANQQAFLRERQESNKQ
jgi:hypothetical protein